ncbi:hypothetical protein [Phocaeicola sp.]
MAKVIERNVPIAEENETLSGQPATNMYGDFSEEIIEKVEIPHQSESDKSKNEENRKKRLEEMDKVVKEDIGNNKP